MTPRTLPSSPRPPGGGKSQCPALPGKWPRLDPTNASFDAQEGRTRAAPPPAPALSRRTPHSPRIFPPRTLQPRKERASLGGLQGCCGHCNVKESVARLSLQVAELIRIACSMKLSFLESEHLRCDQCLFLMD
ncbi:uncharacterized protein ACBT57_006409 isoform 1-T1 [Dama dama]